MTTSILDTLLELLKTNLLPSLAPSKQATYKVKHEEINGRPNGFVMVRQAGRVEMVVTPRESQIAHNPGVEHP